MLKFSKCKLLKKKRKKRSVFYWIYWSMCLLSHVRLFSTWHGLYIAHQTPLSMEFSKQEYWSGLPFPPPGDLLDPVIKPASPESPALASRFFTTVSPIYLVNSSGKFVVVVQSHSCVQLFATHGLQHARLSCPSLYPGVCSNSCLLNWWCHPTVSSSVTPLSFCPQSFPASSSFNELALCIRWTKY